MGRADADVLMVFKQCLDLQPAEQDALLAKHPDLADEVRELLDADDNLRPVEDGFGVGALNLLVATQDAQADDILPTAIGPYRVLRMAGSGATAIVYEAMEAVPRRRVAVKVARATLDPDHHDRFQAEAEALSKIRHQAVPVVFRVGQMAGLPWLAVEWVEGTALGEAPGDWSLNDLALVADGLDAAHQEDVFHGDISPGNLLRTASGPKIVDFGHANVIGERPSKGGTPGFIGPNHLTPSQRDQYAMARIIAVCRPDPGRVLSAVIEAATDTRYDCLSALARDLRAVAADEPVSVVRQTPLVVARRSLRKHRRRWVGLASFMACIAVGSAGYGTVRSQQAAQAERAHNADADADLDVAIAHGRSNGDERAALGEWLSNPRWAGTPAVSRAWHALATLQERALQLEAATESAGRAMVLARTDDQRHQAAQTLARLFTLQGRWSSLERLAEQVPGEQATAWKWQVAVATRDLRRAVECSGNPDLEPLLLQWQQATRTAHRAASAKATPDGVFLLDQLAERLVLAQAVPSLPMQDSQPAISNRFTGFGDRDLHVTIQNDGTQRITRLDVQDGRIHETLIDILPSPALTLSRFDEPMDLAVVGFGPPRRTISWTNDDLTSFHDATTAVRSDVADLLHVRTSTGAERMVAALGPWSAYDLRLFGWDASGVPTLLDRMEMGTTEGLATYNQDGHSMLVVPKSDHYPNRAVFGDDSPTGRPAGLYTFDLTNDRFEQVEFTSFGDVVPSGSNLNDALAGDVDGDGDVDVILRAGIPQKTQMLVVLSTDTGPQVLMMNDMHPLALANLDNDPAMELIVRVNDDDYATWVLGVGEQSLPIQSLQGTTQLTGDIPDDVSALTALGLDRPAALSAEALAARSESSERPTLHLLAAQSWLRFSDTQRAIQALRAAVQYDQPVDTVDTARRLLVTLLVDEMKFDEARELEAGDWPDGLTAAESPPAWQWTPQWDDWELHAVDSIRTPVSPASATLELDNTAGLIASTALDWQHDELLLHYRVALSQLELGSGFEARILRGGEQWVSADVLSFGGGNDLTAISRCRSLQGQLGEAWTVREPPKVTEHVDIQLRLNQVTGRMDCKLRIDGELVHSSSIVTDPPDGDDTVLQLQSTAATTDPMTKAVMTLESLEIRGASQIPSADTSEHDAHQRLLRGDYASAAQVYAGLGRDDLAALARLDGGDATAAAWFGAHPDHPLTRRLHRTRREVGQALHAQQPADYAQRVVRDLGSASRYTNSSDVRALLLHPSLATLPIADADACDVLRLRATAYAFEGRDGAALATLDRLASAPATPALERCQVAASLDAASLLSRSGRVDEARDRVKEAVDRSSTPDLVQSRATRRSDLQSLYPP